MSKILVFHKDQKNNPLSVEFVDKK